MRRFTGVGLVVGVLLVAMAMPSFGADAGQVANTVSTPAPPGACMTLSTTTLDWGTRAFALPGPAGTAYLPVDVIDCSDVDQDIHVAGTNAVSTTSTAEWFLQDSNATCAAGTDLFRVGADNRSDPDVGIALQDGVFQTVGTVSGLGQSEINLGLSMPCDGSSGEGETMRFDINFVVTIP